MLPPVERATRPFRPATGRTDVISFLCRRREVCRELSRHMVGLGGRLPPSTAKLAVPPGPKEIGGREPKIVGYPGPSGRHRCRNKPKQFFSSVRSGIVRPPNKMAIPFSLRDRKGEKMPPLQGLERNRVCGCYTDAAPTALRMEMCGVYRFYTRYYLTNDFVRRLRRCIPMGHRKESGKSASSADSFFKLLMAARIRLG